MKSYKIFATLFVCSICAVGLKSSGNGSAIPNLSEPRVASHAPGVVWLIPQIKMHCLNLAHVATRPHSSPSSGVSASKPIMKYTLGELLEIREHMKRTGNFVGPQVSSSRTSDPDVG